MERLKNMELKKTFLVLSASCVLVALLMLGLWKKMGKTLVIITHDSRIARMADRQFVIVDGVLSEVTAR